MKVRVVVSLVTYNSAPYLEPCLTSLESQTLAGLEIRLWDNASRDETLEIAGRHRSLFREIHASDENAGFCGAHNRIIASTSSDHVLVVNPDVKLAPDFVEKLVGALEADPAAGSATGKLFRWPPDRPTAAELFEKPLLDTTGMYFTKNQRHLDRGAGKPDHGQYDQLEYVFGASGAAALYRRSMLEDIKAGGGYFDEAFFAYREDADLAWRAQWLGWRCLYVPDATGYHVRRVTPERRSSLPPDINMHSFKNRFLLRIRNMDIGTYARYFLPITARDIAALAYVLLREQRTLRACPLFIKAFPGAWAARRELFRRRRIESRELRSWFSDEPVSKPVIQSSNDQVIR